MVDYKLMKESIFIATLIMSPITLNAQEVNDNQNSEQVAKILASPIFAPSQKSEVKRDCPQYIAAYSLMEMRYGGSKFSLKLINNLRNQIRGFHNNDTTLLLLEKEYPGLINAGLDEMMPVIVRQTEINWPILFARQARFISKNMTLREIQELDKILRSPTFRHLRTAIETNIDISSVNELVSEDRGFNESDIVRIHTDTMSNVKPTLSKEDNLYLIEVRLNPAFRKFQKLLPRLNAIEAQWSSEETKEEAAEIEEAAARGYENHIAKFEESESETLETSDREE